MMKTSILVLLCVLLTSYANAQREINDNTFGGIGAGVLAPVGDYKTNFNSGFQINAEINGRIYKPLWFCFDAAFESLPVNGAVLTTAKPVSTLGGGLGLKLFLLHFLYVGGSAGVRGVVAGVIPGSDRTTVYYNLGAGVFPLKFLQVFANYNVWQAQTGYPTNNYIVAGVKFSFGRK
jgi:hypothetical protein